MTADRRAAWCPPAEQLEREFGIPIVNKRISVTPIAEICAAADRRPTSRPSPWPWTRAGKEVGVDFVGGFSALVHKGASRPTYELMDSIPHALAVDGQRLLLRERGLHAGRHQHGRRAARWPASSRRTAEAHRRPPVHRRGQARRVLQRRGGQPLHGRRFPRCRRGRRGCERGRVRPGRGARGARRPAQGRRPDHRGRGHQGHRVQDHARRRAHGAGGLAAASACVQGILDLSLAPTPAERRFRGRDSGVPSAWASAAAPAPRRRWPC